MPKSQQIATDTKKGRLSAAAVILSVKGYIRTTTRSIGEAATVNEVTLFRHFGSTGNLLSVLVNQHSNLTDLTSIIENQLTGDFHQDLTRLGTFFFKMITEKKEALGLILCEAKKILEVRVVVEKVLDKLR